MKSKKMLLAGLFVAGLIASALAYNASSSADGGCCGGQTDCCEQVCAPLCCPDGN